MARYFIEIRGDIRELTQEWINQVDAWAARTNKGNSTDYFRLVLKNKLIHQGFYDKNHDFHRSTDVQRFWVEK